MNVIQMHLYAGLNEHYAKQGKKTANLYASLVTETIERDRSLSQEFATCFDGKWKGMELAKHIGFCKWNEDGCKYPVRMQVEPFDRPRLVVSRKEEETIHVKNYGTPERIVIREFLFPNNPENNRVDIEVANDGTGSLLCNIEMPECSWLSCNWTERTIEEQEILRLSCNEEYLPVKEETVCLKITDGDTVVEVAVHGKKKETSTLPPMTFYEKDGIVWSGWEMGWIGLEKKLGNLSIEGNIKNSMLLVKYYIEIIFTP